MKPKTVSISAERLELLEKKERAHDDYLAAIRAVKAAAARKELAVGVSIGNYAARHQLVGYQGALRDLEEAIVQADRNRDALLAGDLDALPAGEEPDHRAEPVEDRRGALVCNRCGRPVRTAGRIAVHASV